MDLFDNLNKMEIKEFFSKNWLTHDSMWYYHCLQEFGADKANKINQAAVKSMSGIEIQRILKLMGNNKVPIKTFEELKEILDTTYKLIQPKFMKLYYSFPEKNIFKGGFHECFALRKKIEPAPAKPRHILSVRGMGYRFEAERS